MEIARRQLGENTRAVHLPPPPETAQRPLGTPLYRTAACAFSSAEEYAAVLGDQVPGYSYSRIDNPTVDAFARAVAAMEGANLPRWPAAQAFASGMAAISGVFLAFARAGAHVVASAALYGGTYSLLRNVLTRFGVETDFVDITDLDAVRAAVRPSTRIIYAETIANPTTAVADIRHLAEIAHDSGALLVVDSTLAPPVICRPLEHGADLVLHSATKYIGGHSDVTGGVVTGALELISQIRATRIDTGGSLSPDDAFLLRRGLETLPVRVRRQCATASVFAATLARHPAVAYIDYPGLPTHPGHELARRTFDAGPRRGQVRRDRHRHPLRRPRGGAGLRQQAAAGRGGDVARRYAHGRLARRVHHPPPARRPRPRRGRHRRGRGPLLHRPGGRRGPGKRRLRSPGSPRQLVLLPPLYSRP